MQTSAASSFINNYLFICATWSENLSSFLYIQYNSISQKWCTFIFTLGCLTANIVSGKDFYSYLFHSLYKSFIRQQEMLHFGQLRVEKSETFFSCSFCRAEKYIREKKSKKKKKRFPMWKVFPGHYVHPLVTMALKRKNGRQWHFTFGIVC